MIESSKKLAQLALHLDRQSKRNIVPME